MPRVRDRATGRVYEQDEAGEWVQVYGPPVSGAEALLIGTGRELTTLGRGIADLAGGPDPRERQARAAEEALYREVEMGHPIATGIGRALPGLAMAPLGAGTPFGLAAIAEQAGLSALYGFAGEGDLSERLMRAGVGAAAAGAGTYVGHKVSQYAGAFRQGLADAATRRAAGQTAAGTFDVDGTLRLAGTGEVAAAGPEALAERAKVLGELYEAEGRATPILTAPGAERARLMQRGRDMGMGFTFGDTAADPAVRQALKLREAALESDPLLSPLITPLRVRNREIANATALKALGVEGPEAALRVEGALAPQTLGAAADRIGGAFKEIGDELSERVSYETGEIFRLEADSELLEDLVSSFSTLREGLPVLGKREAPKLIGDLRALLEGGITGPQMVLYRSQLAALLEQYSDQRGGALMAQSLRGTLEAFDSWVERNVPEDIAERWIAARSQYRVLQTLQRPGVISAQADINPRALANALRQTYPFEYMRGGDIRGTANLLPAVRDLFDVARIGATFGDVVGNSGTATRAGGMTALTTPAGIMSLVLSGPLSVTGRGLTRMASAPTMVDILAALSQARYQAGAGAARTLGAAAGREAGRRFSERENELER